MKDPIFVENEIVTDWQKIRKAPEIKELSTQQKKFQEFGRRVKEECGEYRGDDKGMKSCMRKVRERVFRKKSGP